MVHPLDHRRLHARRGQQIGNRGQAKRQEPLHVAGPPPIDAPVPDLGAADAARQLMRGGWGAYVALFLAAEGALSVLNDPSGALPAYAWRPAEDDPDGDLWRPRPSRTARLARAVVR